MGKMIAFLTVAVMACGKSGGGGGVTGGGYATGGGAASGGGSATGGGTATGGGSASGGGSATGGGAAAGGGNGAADAGTFLLEIDPQVDQGPLPEIGFNMTYINRGQGLLDDAGAPNTTLRNQFVALGTDWLRYPGGTYANLFDWRTAIGSNRSSFNVFNYLPETNAFGVDEAAQLAEDMGGKLLCVININLGAQVAADWVEYMNAPVGTNPNGGTAWAAVRAANGHPAPYGIVYWELANEFGNGRIWQMWDADTDFLDDASANLPLDTAYRNLVINGGSRRFTNYQAVTPTTWAFNAPGLQLSATAGQVRFTKLAPVQRGSVTVKVGPTAASATAWNMVSSLANSSATATDYEFDERSGQIRFGDGVHGALPPAGVFVFTDFTTATLDGLKQIAAAMKVVDPAVKLGGGFGFIDSAVSADPALQLDGEQFHFVDNSSPVRDFYPTDPRRNLLSRGLGVLDGLLARAVPANPNLRLFATEVHPAQVATFNNVNVRNTGTGAMAVAAHLTSLASRGDRIAVAGPNYLTWTNLNAQSVIFASSAIITAEGWA